VDVLSTHYDEELSLPVIVAWLRLHWIKVGLGGVAFGALALVYCLFRTETFVSSVNLLVFPPAFKDSRTVPSPESEDIAALMPRTLPMELYKTLALSPPILNEVIQTIPLEETGVNTLREQLTVDLVQMGSRTPQGVTYTRALIFNSKADDPELAARIADTWAGIFKRHMDELASEGIGETFELLDILHTNSKSELEAADLALAEHKKAWNLNLVQAQLDAKQLQLTELEKKQKDTEVDLAKATARLQALEEELAEEPEKRVYFRAPTDDAYWFGTLQNGSGINLDQGLRTEEPNQNYTDTRKAAIVAKEELEGFRGTQVALTEKLAELRDEITALNTTSAEKSVERDVLTREADSLKTSYATVRTEYEKGRIADRTQASDIVIAGQAVAPRRPTGPRTLIVVVVATMLGMVLTAGGLLLLEMSRTALMDPHGIAAQLLGLTTGNARPGRQETQDKTDGPPKGNAE